MPGEVHAHPAEEVPPLGPDLPPDHLTDLLLQGHVPGGPPGCRHREGGAHAGHTAPRAVDEPGAGDAEPLDQAVHDRHAVVALRPEAGQALPEVLVAVQQPQPLFVPQPLVELTRHVRHRAPAPYAVHCIVERRHLLFSDPS